MKLNANDSAYYCSISNILRYNYPQLVVKYAPDNSWYIVTMNEVFELGGSLVRDAVAHNMMRLLAEG